jgi:phosphate:Na+ symporter
MGSYILLDLAGGIALLLWGLHMVQTGIMRAFGADLRHFLGHALGNRVAAFFVGIGVTTLLQSSTATGLMLGSFSAAGMIALTSALAVMLGANVGTTLVVQFLSLNVSVAAPVLLLGGVVAFRHGQRTRSRDLGRVAIGLGLMLLSLHILLDTLAPAENAPDVQTVLQIATRQPALNVLAGAALAWAAHSSIAVVLLVSSLGYSHFVTPAASLALVLGANLGTAINPVLEGGGLGSMASRRVAVGNLITRVVGCALALPFLGVLAPAMAHFDPDPVRQVADFHTFFNVALALIFIVPLRSFARLLERLMPDKKGAPRPSEPVYLDAAAIETPSLALTSAAREALHMGDIVETMLRQGMTALMTDDRRLVSEVERMDNAVDKLHEAIKLYVTGLTRASLDDSEGRRAMEIISFSINLEHIGDIIDKNLMELAGKKIKHKLKFSDEGAAELEAFHGRVLANLKLAFSVFISGDVKMARKLLEEKVAIRESERQAADHHFARLREGRVESIETSSLHLDILRDLKRIHSHICAAAYPVLEMTGELQPSRLRTLEAELVRGGTAENGLAAPQPR